MNARNKATEFLPEKDLKDLISSTKKKERNDMIIGFTEQNPKLSLRECQGMLPP